MKKFFLKSVVRATLPVVLVVSMLTGIMTARVGICANRADQLGSAVAVGSPVLNQNFAEDSWNPYELECFGVYLSNFVEPLTQTYKECFTDGGSGTYALQMSTKNDPVNNKTLKGLLDFAIGYEFNHSSALYISKYGFEGNGEYDKETKCPATLRSLYSYGSVSGYGDDGVWYLPADTIQVLFEKMDSNRYMPVPSNTVFYKEVEGQTKIMFDSTNSFDCDALNALLAYEFNTNGEDFSKNFYAMLDQPLAVDSFGNIVIASSGQMVFPACLNTHATKDGCINYVNRYMMNSYTRGGSAQLNIDWQTSDVYAAYIRGPIYTDWKNDMGFAGYPINASTSGSTGMFYGQSADLLYTHVGSKMVKVPNYNTSGMITAGASYARGSMDYWYLDDASKKARYQALYDLMTSDFTMGENSYGMRFANPLNVSLCVGGGKSGWNTTDQGSKTNGFDTGEPSLYLVIQLNSIDTTSAMTFTQRQGGYSPATRIFNEIYFPSEDGAYVPVFKSSTSWRVISSQLWAANNAVAGINDQGKVRCECSQAFINGLSHSVYDFTHGADSQTYTNTSASYGPFGAFATTFLDNIPKCVDGTQTMSFATLTNCTTNKTKYAVTTLGGEGDLKFTSIDQLKDTGMDGLTNTKNGGNDPDCLTPAQNFYKIYSLSDDSYVMGLAQGFDNGVGTFEDACSYIYVSYLNYFMIGRENDEYGVKTAVSDFDPMFFDSNLLFDDFSAMGISAPSNEEQEVAARNRMMLLLDPEKGADYRREIVTSTLTKFCTDSYNKMTGKQFGSSASSALCLQEIAENPFTGWLVDHEVWIILLFTFVALVLASWAAITRGKGWFWAICQIAVGIVGVVMIPFVLNAGVRVANFASQKIYSANADIWWLSDAVENRYAEIGLADLYNENAESYEDMGLSKEQMANIVLGSNKYQSITFGQDISNKQVMPMEGLYAHLSQYPSAAWILPTLLDQSTVEDESAGGYTIRVGAFKKLSELETLYWGYFPGAIGDTPTWQTATVNNKVPSAYNTGVDRTDYGCGVTGKDGSIWYYNSMSELIPSTERPMHNSVALTANFDKPTYNGFLNNDSVWKSTADSAEKIYLIEKLAFDTTPTDNWRRDKVGASGNTFHAHIVSKDNDEYDWYLKGTESPLPYFYCVVQDTFEGFNTAQTIDALVGTTEYYGEGKDDYWNLNFLQATKNGTYNVNGSGSAMSVDHTWQPNTEGTDYARDILDLNLFYRYYAPLMYQQAIKTGGSQMGLAIAENKYDIVGSYGDLTIKDTNWDYPIYEQNYASWMFNCNWAVKLYENPQNIKLQTVRDSAGNSSTVCPINPYTYPDNRPFMTCRAQMECYGLDDGDLSTVELACVQANDEAMLEIIKTINVYTNAPATLDVNSFKDLLAVKCLSAYANNINQAALTNSKYRIIPNGFEFDGICYDTVFSQMVYNTHRKANAYTVEDAVEGYIADEGPIMALFLTATAALGAVIIPFVLRIGLALLYVVNLWAALNAVIESLEQKASVLLASVVNTASFTIRTVMLFLVQGFLMSMGGAGVIVQKNQITFRGSTTMLIITLLVFYILYTISIIEFFSRTVQNGNDMGAAYLKANYEMSRDQGLLRFAQHRFAQSWGGKMLNAASRGMLGNEPKTSATGSGTTTQATGTNDMQTSGSGEGGEGGGNDGGSVGNNVGGNTIEKAKDRSNVSLNQAAERTHAKGKDNPAGGSYIKESMEKGKQVDTRSEAFMEKAFGKPNESGTSSSGAEAGRSASSGIPKPKDEPKPEKPKPEKPKDDGPKAKI